MPSFQQPSTTMIKPLPAGAVAGSPEYNQYLTDRYATDTQPAFKRNMRAGRNYMRSTRGLADSGLEGAYAAGNVQQQNQDVNRFAADLGQQSAGFAQQDAVRKQIHDWQVSDETRRMSEAKDQQARMAAQRKQAADDALWGNILKSAGQMIGTYYGGPAGGAAAGAGADYLIDQDQEDLSVLDPYAM